MKKSKIKIDLKDRSYDILIDSDLFSDINHFLCKKKYNKIFLITDKNVADLYLETFKKNIDIHHEIILPSGEKSKSFSTFKKTIEEILKNNIDRNSLIIAFGGGVVGDLSGFIASTILRGIDFIQIPTTLLSMVDSSIGGKTAINSESGKNLIGSFYQPRGVFCDINFLYSLSEREFLSGYAEVLKYSLIYSEDFFYLLNKKIIQLKNRNKDVLQKIIEESCYIKSKIVSMDERENKNFRILLNFGHTIGHALESEAKYSNRILHGEAVAIGMNLANILAVELKILSETECLAIESHLRNSGLSHLPNFEYKSDNLIKYIKKDKKSLDGKINFILLSKIGKSYLHKNIDERIIKNLLDTHKMS